MYRGDGEFEVGLGETGDDLPRVCHVMGGRGLSVGGPQQQGKGELRGASADDSPPEALRNLRRGGERLGRVEAFAGEKDLPGRARALYHVGKGKERVTWDNAFLAACVEFNQDLVERPEWSVTGLYPYGRYALNDRVTVWGVAGYGAGTLTLTPEKGEPYETDMDLAMAAAGLRGVVAKAPAGVGPELAVKTDAMAVRTSSDGVTGRPGGNGHLAAETAAATRLRLALEGTCSAAGAGSGAEHGVGFRVTARF